MNTSYIGEIIKVLQGDDYYDSTENIEIAKGKYYLCYKPEFLKKQLKRKIKLMRYERNKDRIK